MTYGEKIAELRKQNNMTQAELGSALNVTFQAVSKWENGLSEPDLNTIKKICELFHISMDEFFGTQPPQQPNNNVVPQEAPPVAQTTAQETATTDRPLAYCDDCNRPLYDIKDYTVSSNRTGQTVLCNDCKKKRKQRKRERTADEIVRQRRRGFIWGAVGGVLLAVALVVAGVTTNDNLLAILGGVLGCYGGFAFTAQMIWENSVMDVFLFFLKSFHLPGLIFTLDLDGILWFLTVKLIGGIICGILSAILFIIGIIVSIAYSMISFPIAVIRQIRGAYSD